MAGLIKRMQRKLSVKIGLSFLAAVITIELVLFVSLYLLVLNTMVQQQVNNLVTRGESYARVLALDFSPEMMEHAVLTGVDDNSAMVIQNADNQILKTSQPVNSVMEAHLKELQKKESQKSEILHYHWFGDAYIVSSSPILKNGTLVGKVDMFLDTAYIQQLVFKFTSIFVILAFLTLAMTFLATFYLSRNITRPLLKIKEGTEKIAQGELSLSLNVKTHDELGELANSIENLAQDLDKMKLQRNDFLASVAHELRTPLTFIKGYADIASRANVSETQREDYLTIIREETERLTRLMEDLIALAQLEENTFKIEKVNVQVDEFLTELSNKISVILAQKDIHLETTGARDFVAEFDPVRMEQVLMNLLTNAYKYSAEHSVISLDVRCEERTFSFIITDQGDGISDEELPHIFERFYRVDKSRTRKTGGFGLGLSIVADIVRMHQGKIFAVSELGIGTQIEVQLPYN